MLPIGAPNPVQNNLAFGWGQALAVWEGFGCDYSSTPPCTNTFPYNSGYTATDLLSSYTGSTFTPPAGMEPISVNYSATPFPGGDSMSCGPFNNSSCFGLRTGEVFVNPTIGPNLDLRLKAGSPAIGAGNNFSMPSTFVTLTRELISLDNHAPAE